MTRDLNEGSGHPDKTGSRTEPLRRRIRRLRAALVGALALVGAVTLAACGGQGSIPSDNSVARSGPVRPAVSTITLDDIDHVGPVLVDGAGFTLYLFEPDHQSSTTCSSLCLAEWPALTIPEGTPLPVAGPGVDQNLIGADPFGSGQEQITYNRWPLYLWVEDQQPGQDSGEDVSNFGGPWYVIDASGNAVVARKGL